MAKIFVIDDNKEFLEIMELLLGTRHSVKKYNGFNNLVTDVVSFEPDLILLDHFLRTHTSKEVVEKLTTAIMNFNVPVILISAMAHIEMHAKAINAVDYIAKPCGIDDIENCVENVLSKYTVASH